MQVQLSGTASATAHALPRIAKLSLNSPRPCPGGVYPSTPMLSIGSRRHMHAVSISRPRHVVASAASSIRQYGVPEESSDGWMQTFGFPLEGDKVGKELFRFPKGAEAVPVTLERPLGVIFEERQAGGKIECFVDELVEGGNAEASGEVKVGDVLRATTAVMKGREKVTVGKFQVEPSLAQRQQGQNQLAYFVADGQPFERVMGALTSFSNPVETDEGLAEISHVSLLLERRSG